MAIISKRGKKLPEKPVEQQPSDVDHIEINFAEFDDHPINKDGQQEFEYYKEDWIIQNCHALRMMDPTAALPTVGDMVGEPFAGMMAIWDGSRWLKVTLVHLQKLLQPKTQRVTMGQHEYEVVVK
jgi:hypothetical protein